MEKNLEMGVEKSKKMGERNFDFVFHFFFGGNRRKEKVRSPAACFQKETAAQKAMFIPDP